MKIQVYTDGSATTNNKSGGWAYLILIDGDKHSENSGKLTFASNNDAELEAAIQGLAATLKICKDAKNLDITLLSDSQLILGWASGLYKFKQISKIEKYNQLQFLVKRMNVKTAWVQGHSGNEYNDRCDLLANEARKGCLKDALKEEAKLTGESLIGTKKEGVISIWYKGKLRIVDLDENVIEVYNREIHGRRGSILEIREEKNR
jgi:ribonuclease HI